MIFLSQTVHLGDILERKYLHFFLIAQNSVGADLKRCCMPPVLALAIPCHSTPLHATFSGVALQLLVIVKRSLLSSNGSLAPLCKEELGLQNDLVEPRAQNIFH